MTEVELSSLKVQCSPIFRTLYQKKLKNELHTHSDESKERSLVENNPFNIDP